MDPEPLPPQGRERRLTGAVLAALACAAADATTTFLLTSSAKGTEANVAIAGLVAAHPWAIFPLLGLWVAPLPLLPKLPRAAAAVGWAVGSGGCALHNFLLLAFGVGFPAAGFPFWLFAAAAAAAGVAVFAILKLTRMRTEPVLRSAAWCLLYGLYVGALGAGFWWLGGVRR
jgi:hypothetical protein